MKFTYIACTLAFVSGQETAPYVIDFTKYSTNKELRNSKTGLPGTLRAAIASADLINKKDNYYLADVVIGEGQTFKMVLDTGSSDTWVRGPNCVAFVAEKPTETNAPPGDRSCDGKFLNLSDKTVKALNKTADVSYLDGSGSRFSIYSAPVALGGANASFPIGVSYQESGFEIADGLMGLGYDSVSGISNATKTNANFIDSLNLPGESNVFGFYLSNSVDNTNGSISIGGIDKTKFTGPINYFPVIRKRVWEIDISKMTFNVGGFKGPMSIQSTAIADSGTSNFLLEARVANSVNSAVGARLIPTQSMIYEIDCMALKTGVDVVLSMSGVDFVFPPASYIQEIQLSNNQKACITRFNAGASKISIFGDAFNRAYYTIYDKANHRVGFAKAVHKTAELGTPTSPTATNKPNSSSISLTSSLAVTLLSLGVLLL